MFANSEFPVAHSMVEMARQIGGDFSHLVPAFMCYWVAFNNIYVTVAEQAGQRARLDTNADGSPRTRKVGSVNVPRVNLLSERAQIDLALKSFPDRLKRDLVGHQSTQYFVDRTPRWQGQPITADAGGQRLNGVLNVGCTLDSKHPVWAPIDTGMFRSYREDESNAVNCNALARQILEVLYTVRNNTFHAGKRLDDASDLEVLDKALPLLVMIVASFVPIREAA